jgi:hypothetical protein
MLFWTGVARFCWEKKEREGARRTRTRRGFFPLSFVLLSSFFSVLSVRKKKQYDDIIVALDAAAAATEMRFPASAFEGRAAPCASFGCF